MQDIEHRLGQGALGIARRNRLRNATTDVNVFLQQEARFRALSHNPQNFPNWPRWPTMIDYVSVGEWLENIVSSSRVPVPQTHPYVQEVFSACDPLERQQFWMRLYCKFKFGNPWFVAIDDDVKSNTSGCRAQHRLHLNELLTTFLGDAAPWELADVVAEQQATIAAAATEPWRLLHAGRDGDECFSTAASLAFYG